MYLFSSEIPSLKRFVLSIARCLQYLLCRHSFRGTKCLSLVFCAKYRPTIVVMHFLRSEASLKDSFSARGHRLEAMVEVLLQSYCSDGQKSRYTQDTRGTAGKYMSGFPFSRSFFVVGNRVVAVSGTDSFIASRRSPSFP